VILSRPPVEPPSISDASTELDVLGHRHRRDEREVLVDHADSSQDRVAR
jgi:hypothetical protein